MNSIIKCNTVTLSGDQGDVNSNIKKIDTSIATLRQISSKLDSMWDGDASVAYKQKLDNYIKELEDVNNRLKKITAYEGKAVSSYNNCEKAVSGIVSGISV